MYFESLFIKGLFYKFECLSFIIIDDFSEVFHVVIDKGHSFVDNLAVIFILSDSVLKYFLLSFDLFESFYEFIETLFRVSFKFIKSDIAEVDQCWVVFLIFLFFQNEIFDIFNSLFYIIFKNCVDVVKVISVLQLALYLWLHDIIAQFLTLGLQIIPV